MMAGTRQVGPKIDVLCDLIPLFSEKDRRVSSENHKGKYPHSMQMCHLNRTTNERDGKKGPVVPRK